MAQEPLSSYASMHVLAKRTAARHAIDEGVQELPKAHPKTVLGGDPDQKQIVSEPTGDFHNLNIHPPGDSCSSKDEDAQKLCVAILIRGYSKQAHDNSLKAKGRVAIGRRYK
eukprot:1136928-Pelagomonas_calceolata.AAC.3